jgi:flagellar hook-basal body complex protein FliE
MSTIGSISSAFPALSLDQATAVALPKLPITDGAQATTAPSGSGFGSMLEGLVSMVGESDAKANALTNSVMLGNSSQLHQSVIAMQEASVALSLMVQVRNKLVDSYQELMRMSV